MVISSLFVRSYHLHYFEKLLWHVLYELRKNKKLKRMYPFEGRIVSRDGYYVLRNVSRVTMVTIIRGCITRRDGCMDKYVPHGSQTKRQPVYITRLDMHHYTWNYIPLHRTYLSLVNLILCFADLVNVILWNMWLMNTELVFEDI